MKIASFLQDSDMKNQGFLRLLLPALVGAPSRYSAEDPSERLLQASHPRIQGVAVHCQWETVKNESSFAIAGIHLEKV